MFPIFRNELYENKILIPTINQQIIIEQDRDDRRQLLRPIEKSGSSEDSFVLDSLTRISGAWKLTSGGHMAWFIIVIFQDDLDDNKGSRGSTLSP